MQISNRICVKYHFTTLTFSFRALGINSLSVQTQGNLSKTPLTMSNYTYCGVMIVENLLAIHSTDWIACFKQIKKVDWSPYLIIICMEDVFFIVKIRVYTLTSSSRSGNHAALWELHSYHYTYFISTTTTHKEFKAKE